MKRLNKTNSKRDDKKVSLLCAVFCLSFVITACANTKFVVSDNSNNAEWMLTDSTLVKQIGDSLKQVFFDPDTVKCYHISYKEKLKEKDIEVVKDYVRDSLVSILSASQTNVLQYILLADVLNYSNDSVLVQSPYLPTVEFVFCKKDFKHVSVVISTLDRSWQILWSGKQIHAHNIANTNQIERFINYFMNIFKKKESKK